MKAAAVEANSKSLPYLPDRLRYRDGVGGGGGGSSSYNNKVQAAEEPVAANSALISLSRISGRRI